ncbi:glycoside hydrolase family 3 N-terminal domain-containing protein [Cellulomonas sp. PhB143]|uniref:glycoside hydrolase family 3 N-terminal domain-containing protein n=1 Tax=Cellulomonas sp. PhB143 TaxID=2485186 RepID=UPI0011CE3883|nr:glycoside hydrolase family 3 N-terminal domain-containing protein [Cellulomonas sp. PhB143]
MPASRAPRPRVARRRGSAAAAVVAALALALVGAVPVAATAAPGDPGLGDLALDATATASQSQDDQDGAFPPQLATDGDGSTRWASGNGPDEDVAYDQWFQLDLGSVADLDSLRLAWEASYATAFTVEVASEDPGDGSDPSVWTQAYATTDGPGGEQVVPLGQGSQGTQGRWVRIAMTQRAAATWEAPTLHYYGYSLYDVEVWGTSGTVTAGFVGSASATDAGEEISVPVRLSQPRDTDTTLHVTSADGTATAGEDYAAVDADVVVPAGETTAAVTTTSQDHGALAGDRDLTLALSLPDDAPEGLVLGARDTHTVTLRAHGDLPDVGATVPLDDFEETPLPLTTWGADAAATPVLTRVASDRPGAPDGGHALSADVAAIGAGGWGGFTHDFTQAHDWSAYGAFTFWFRGTGSGSTLRYELKSGGSSPDSATKFETSFVDAEAGWHQVSVRFDALRKKDSPGAPDRFDASAVHGYAVTLSDLGAGTWLFDDVSVVERAASIIDFEGDVPLTVDTEPVGIFAWGADAGSKPTVEVTADDRGGAAPSDNHVLSGTYQVPAGKYGGISHDLAAPQDWSGYGGLRFWWYASQDSRPASPTAGADITVELKDGGPDGEHAELWRTSFKDSWSADGSRWKLVELPFSSFTLRGDYQPGPASAQDGELSLTRSWGYAITMPTDTPRTGWAIDDVQIYGSPRAAVAATVTAPPVTLVDAGDTASVDVRVTTSDGEPLASDVEVGYGPGTGGTAQAGTDYEDFGGTLTFPAGTESGATQPFEVVTAAADEPAEALTVPVALTVAGDVVASPRVVVNAHGMAYLDDVLATADRVDDLLGRMSLAEKVGQMTQAERLGLSSADDVATLGLGSVLSGGGSVPAQNTPEGWADMVDGYQRQALSTPLQIPMIYGVDAVHGHNNVVGATLFPHNIGLGATRDPGLVEEAGTVTATEVRSTGIPWTFAPCLCVTRDERWGRSYESFGEDPALVKAFAAPAITGLQGRDAADMDSPSTVLATAKHWLGDGGTTYDESVTGSGYPIDQGVTRVADAAELDRLYVDPYRPAIAAGVGSVMPSYSAMSIGGADSVRMHENGALNTDLLKGELGFDGFTISDWEGIDKLPGGTYQQKAARAVNGGVDMAMAPYNYAAFVSATEANVASGVVSEARVDDAVRRILTQKFAVGLFDHPFADRSEQDAFGSDAHRSVARQAAAESQVLLKNDGVLPLADDADVYVAGSTADDLGRQLGGWSVSWQGGAGEITRGTTIGDAITAASSGDVTVSPDASAPTDGADVGVVVVGEKPYAEGVGDVRYGADSQFSLTLSAQDRTAIDTVCGAMDCVVLVVSGRPQLVADQLDEMDGLVASWLPGTEGEGVADVLFGESPFTGRLPVTWPSSDDHVPDNVGDAGYDPQFAYGWGLRTDAPRDRLEGLVGDLTGKAAAAVQAVLDADVWADDGTVADPEKALRLLYRAAGQLGGADAWTDADPVVSVARDLAQQAVVDGSAVDGHAVLTSDAEHALLSGDAATAVQKLAAVLGLDPSVTPAPLERTSVVALAVPPLATSRSTVTVAVAVVDETPLRKPFPTGTVVVRDAAGTQVGTASLSAKGTASVRVPAGARGLHALTVAYAGDATHAASSGRTGYLVLR